MGASRVGVAERDEGVEVGGTGVGVGGGAGMSVTTATVETFPEVFTTPA